jgi:FkbM family methyltransferase
MIMEAASCGETSPGSADRFVSVRVPLKNRLEYVQRWSPQYDFWLPKLLALASTYFPDEVIVDVGANVGDTVLAARLAGCTSKIVAIEASPSFAATLRENLAANRTIAGETEVVEAVVVGRTANVKFELHGTGTGKTELIESASGGDAGQESKANGRVVRLSDLSVAQCSVLKTDTDGFDAFILDGAIDWLGRVLPIIWAETEVTSAHGVELWRSVLTQLRAQGYSRFVLFDNEGAFCCDGMLDATSEAMLGDLISYSYSTARRFAKGQRLKMPINYFDIALFPDSRRAVFSEFMSRVRRGS